MKRKLNGLLSLWLAVMMILSSVAVFAEGETITDTIYVYQKTTPLKYGDYNNISIESLVSDGIFAQIDDFRLNEPITPQVEAAEKLPATPDGYESDGWRLWSYGSGMHSAMLPSVNAENQEIISTEDSGYNYYNFLESLWAIKYKITKQPTADNPSVKVNYPEDVLSYQWYEAEPAVYITDENATAINGADFRIEGASSCDSNVWTGAFEAYETDISDIYEYSNYYFSIDLKAGDTILVYPESKILEVYMLNSNNFAPVGFRLVSDGVYALTASQDGSHILATTTEEANATITAELLPALDKNKAVENQTKAELDAEEINTYLCEITFKYNDIITNEPIKLYSDRVTTTDVAPEGHFTISFDANGGSGTMKNVYVKENDNYKLPECDFEAPEDMVFDCWEINDKIYEPGDKIGVKKDVEVIARWCEEGVVSTPEFTPDGGKFTSSSLDVKITCDTPRVTIYYTTNGEDPKDSSKRKMYEGNVNIKADTTIKAYAVKDGMEDSEVATAFFDKRTTAGSSGGSSYGGTTSIKSYTVKFNTKGGLTVADQYVSRNKTVKEPEKVTKYGYTFEGWYTDEKYTTKYDFDTPVTKSFTLYAKWSEGEESTGNSSGGTLDNRIILTIGQYKMLVFGEEIIMDVVPQIVNDRTMLPARHVAEALGATVEWNESEPKKVRITKDNTEIIIWIDSDTAYVNGEAVTLDSPAFLENDRTYTPVRFICENLGATVDWEEGEQKVIIIVDR